MITDPHWHRIGKSPHNGIVVILSALRSKNSCGIGEFLDLIPIIDWCSSIGLDVIQLLPLNDTGNDSSPYSALSSCALDPIYLSLYALPDPIDPIDSFKPLASMDRVPFFEVKEKKTEWLKRYFQHRFKTVSKTKEYQDYVDRSPWLPAYAQFKALKEKFGGACWVEWPAITANEPDDLYRFLQFLCHQQMTQVRIHAESRKLFLKGDVPILLSPDSADVWAEKELFTLDFAAGAPPDQYNQLGQKWGFPLYNWQRMKDDGYRWWKRRLAVAGAYYHIYRIDHIVGFFRIWAIPPGKKALDGRFIPPDPAQWPDHGREILAMMIHASPLLPMGEDLGTIPRFVPEVLKELGICGTKVMRWERHWDHERTLIPFDHYEPLSLTTVSTHDLEPLGQWWKKFPEEAASYAHYKRWTYQPELTAGQRFDILRDSHHTASYFHINLLQETLALFPELVRLNPEEERLNIPGTILPTNWTYRYRPFIEQIVSHTGLKEAFDRILQ